MLLRCCTATLLLLLAGSAQCLSDCVLPWCHVHSGEDVQRYTTRLTFKPSVDEYVVGFTSHTVDIEGTVVARVNVTFIPGTSARYIPRALARRFDEGRTWMTKSPFVKDFWLGDFPRVSQMSVHVYNMSINPTYVSNLRDSDLKELELTGNSWDTSPPSLELPRLKKLSLSDNRIKELQHGLLAGCFSLEVLDLSRNKFGDHWGSLDALWDVGGTLKELNLAENILGRFKPFEWNFRGNIQKLNLSYNEIRFFELYYIPVNCEVDLSFNNITEFPYAEFYERRYSFRVDRMVFSGQNISTLSEVGTFLSNIDREMFEHSIRYLDLVNDNRIRVQTLYVPQSQCTVHKKYIHCKGSASNIFHSWDSSLVNLTGNSVKMDRKSVFEIWPENLVDLSQNRLKVLKDVPWQILDARQLNLSRNSIGYISRELFQNMTRLTVLDLSYNHLKHVQLFLYSSLHMLDISNNCLNRMNILHNSSQYTTEYLNLSHNSFRNILENEWAQFKQFSKVDLGENDFECCGPQGKYSRTMFLRYQDKILNINSTKALTCVRPYYGRVEMTNAWLSENHCEFIHQGWVAVGCLVLLFPLLMHAVDLLDYFMHQNERDLAEQLTRLKKQGLEQDENCALECHYDAFVCHSHRDAGWVTHELVPNLENDRDGHSLCIQYRDFPLGSLIEQNVEKAINMSRKVIVVVTWSFLDSYWCKMELTYAWMKMLRERRNFIIVIEVDRIPEDKRPPILCYLMHSRTHLEWPEAPTDDVKRNCWRRVRDALGKSLRERQKESGTAVFQMDCEDLHNI